MQERENVVNAEDRDVAALISAAGPRPRLADGAAAEVRAAVEAEWRATVAGRRQRRNFTAWAAAAGLGAAAVAVWLARPLYLPASDPVASVARVEGGVEYRVGLGEDWVSAATAVSLRPGDELRTNDSGRVAVKFNNGIEVRLDTGTQLALVDSSHAVLARGGVYVDSGEGAEARLRDLEIGTPLGDVRHLGTQYQARLLDGALQVAVREGRVEVGTKATTVVGGAGEQLIFADGGVTRAPLPAHAGQWAWIGLVTPPFSIEGKSVDTFLAWAGRETGRAVDYASPTAAQQAHAIVLRGSVAGLTPEQAISAVLSTTPLRLEIQADRIRIEEPAS